MDSQIDPKILSKIKKCLALAGSSNPHEAAAAMRQAKALMDKHNVTSSLIAMSDIGEVRTEARTMSRDKPAKWELLLVSSIGQAFGCKLIFTHAKFNIGYANQGAHVFVGLKHQAEIAAYTASVLVRKCKKARESYIKNELCGLATMGRGMKAKATRMADMFAEGWALQMHAKVLAFANTPEVDSAINEFVEKQTNGRVTEPRKPKESDIGKHEIMALHAGKQAAQGESIHRPMGKNDDALMICA